tara:strand:+ start:498 stop:1646 length:1149 start_codon:yes stop_codon:yes gene_type:complete
MIKKNYHFPSKRSYIDKFLVMDIFSRSSEIERKGKKVFHFELGEPLKMTPIRVVNKTREILSQSLPGYTPSNGILELRVAISKYYKIRYNTLIHPDDVFVTVGSSSAFLLTFLTCFDPGDTVLIFSPCYPAYRNMLKALNINVLEVHINKLDNIKNMKNKVRGIILSSPNNPTGKILKKEQLEFLYNFCEINKIFLISDEIYHGIEFKSKSPSISAFGKYGIVINSFSKYFCMPGWRLGWTIVPKNLQSNFMKLAQNLFISCGNVAQLAAIEIFECIDDLEKIVQIYKKNRDIVFDNLLKTPWNDFTKSEGAFYTYVNILNSKENSTYLVKKILEETSVALTPGNDFDKLNGKNYIRLSFSSETNILKEGMKKLRSWINSNY